MLDGLIISRIRLSIPFLEHMQLQPKRKSISPSLLRIPYVAAHMRSFYRLDPFASQRADQVQMLLH